MTTPRQKKTTTATTIGQVDNTTARKQREAVQPPSTWSGLEFRPTTIPDAPLHVLNGRTASKYATTRTVYNVTAKHATGYAQEITTRHAVEVVTVTNGDNVTRRCSAHAFGCSRDYSTFAAADDAAAIRLWLTEHNCRATVIDAA